MKTFTRVKTRKGFNLRRTAIMRVNADIGAHWDTSWEDNWFLYQPEDFIRWHVSQGKKYTNISFEFKTIKEARDYVNKGAEYFNKSYSKMQFFMAAK
jgi:hypothetical protein